MGSDTNSLENKLDQRELLELVTLQYSLTMGLTLRQLEELQCLNMYKQTCRTILKAWNIEPTSITSMSNPLGWEKIDLIKLLREVFRPIVGVSNSTELNTALGIVLRSFLDIRDAFQPAQRARYNYDRANAIGKENSLFIELDSSAPTSLGIKVTIVIDGKFFTYRSSIHSPASPHSRIKEHVKINMEYEGDYVNDPLLLHLFLNTHMFPPPYPLNTTDEWDIGYVHSQE